MLFSSMSKVDAIVVGAGVSGLTTAHELLRAGFRVELWAKDQPPHTTADVAAAFWYPFLVDPSPEVDLWAGTSLPVFEQLASLPETGVVMRRVEEHLPEQSSTPGWLSRLRELRCMPPGRHFVAPVIETPRYMPWLVDAVQAMGARIVERSVSSLDEVLEAAPIVVNATGLGARNLCDDRELEPLEGILVKIPHPPNATGWSASASKVILDESDPSCVTYIVPRRDDIVLGGTAERREPGQPSHRTPEPEEVQEILRRAGALVPALAASTPELVEVGYRPYRRRIRVALESRSGGVVAHNYGHGGAGVTLSWGCASDLVGRLVALGYPARRAATRPAS